MNENGVDFYIAQAPVGVRLECPHCESDIEIDWEDCDVPDYWGDSWGEVECPYCDETIQLGEWEID